MFAVTSVSSEQLIFLSKIHTWEWFEWWPSECAFAWCAVELESNTWTQGFKTFQHPTELFNKTHKLYQNCSVRPCLTLIFKNRRTVGNVSRYKSLQSCIMHSCTRQTVIRHYLEWKLIQTLYATAAWERDLKNLQLSLNYNRLANHWVKA